MLINRRMLEKIPFPSPNPHVNLYTVTYVSGNIRVKGWLAEPINNQVYDGFLYLRGGIKRVGMVRPARIAQFASEGFIVFAPFYRGNRGGEGNEDFGGEDREDAYSGFDLLAEYSRVKDKRVHIFGFSRGGVMAIWTAIERRSAVSLVTWGGVSDMFLTYEERVDLRRMMKRVIGGTPTRYPEKYYERTPLSFLEKMTCPTLIIHGVHDKNVSIDHAKKLEDALKKESKTVKTKYFSEYTHYFPPAVNRQMVQYLSNWMKEN